MSSASIGLAFDGPSERGATMLVRSLTRDRLAFGRLLDPERHRWLPPGGRCGSVPTTCPRCGAEHLVVELPCACSGCGARLAWRCPWVGCRHHLWMDVTKGGSLKLSFPRLEPWELRETCALRAAELGGARSLREVGLLLGVTRERVRQIEERALEKLRAAGVLSAEWLEGFAAEEGG